MHKLFLNTLRLDFYVLPVGPLLIKSGVEDGVDPTLPNMNFVRSLHPHLGQETIYLPGSSLKGVIRSHAERIVRTVMGEAHACDPLGDAACDRRIDNDRRRGHERTGAEVYRDVCAVCKTFGDTVMASRFTVADAYPVDTQQSRASDYAVSLPIRQMVAIDRRSGGSINTFTLEVVTEGAFLTAIVMRNFERWQVGLLAMVLRDLILGRVGIGFGKSRGLGQVLLEYANLSVSYPGQAPNRVQGDYLHGASDLLRGTAQEAMIAEYGLMDDPAVWNDAPHFDRSVAGVTVGDDGWGSLTVQLQGHELIENVFRNVVPSWQRFAQGG